jgi:SDR family mycofactocin-dependent oxidoreductase
MERDRFSGRTVMVTGAARGQGRAFALAFASEGADLAICDVGSSTVATVDYALASTDDLASVAQEVSDRGRRSVARACDIRDQEQVDAFVRAAVDELGSVDVLVTNAGVLGGNLPTHELTDEQWQTMIDINLTGGWRVARAVVPRMIEQGGGRIVNIASVAGLVGTPNFGHYCASKHGVLGLTKSMAAELASHGITVNAVCPGLVDTAMVQHSLQELASQTGMTQDEAYDQYLNVQLIHERITPDEIAAAVLYLASDAARSVTGVALPIDAGWSVT